MTIKDEEYYKLVISALNYYKYRYDEDMVQDIVIYVFQKTPEYDETKGSFSNFVYSLVKQKYMNIKTLERTKKRNCGKKEISIYQKNSKGLDLLHYQSDDEDILDDLVKQDFLKRIQPLIEEPLRLYLEGYTQKEIAKKLNYNNQGLVSIAINKNICKIRNIYKNEILKEVR